VRCRPRKAILVVRGYTSPTPPAGARQRAAASSAFGGEATVRGLAVDTDRYCRLGNALGRRTAALVPAADHSQAYGPTFPR
jgi:hypothetical protein